MINSIKVSEMQDLSWSEEYCDEPNDVLPPGYEEWKKEFDSRRLYLKEQ